jgi:hypothetical protein
MASLFFRGARGEKGNKLRSNNAGLDAKGRLFVLYATPLCVKVRLII